jgi:hypothetical protein
MVLIYERAVDSVCVLFCFSSSDPDSEMVLRLIKSCVAKIDYTVLLRSIERG